MLQLTDEQQSIVSHDYGPALVFAVAGSGKTTAMVHRIERLVREKVFPAHKILATSFSKAAVNDIKHLLRNWSHCERVRTSTLHALGFQVVRQACSRGMLGLSDAAPNNIENKANMILNATIREARRRKTTYIRELDNLDREDFLSYVGACKGNLRYADLEQLQLPVQYQGIAQQAEAPSALGWYLDFYRLFETVRIQQKQITFDDMLMTGWELLCRFPELLADFQGQYHSIVVDEFQDINLAQSEILDLLTQGHRNFMVIGDDDQTIYEWRGATPQFILGFQRRYNAQKYIIRDNFRSKASHLVLANRVIQHNSQREPKQLSLTKGFSGKTYLHTCDDSLHMAAELVDEIQKIHKRGMPLKDISILVRFYAQTPQIEQLLIDKQLPYKVIGNPPFYQRPEIQVLLYYLQIAKINNKLDSRQPLDDEDISTLRRVWRRVYNRPSRYISAEIADNVIMRVFQENCTITRSLRLGGMDASSRVAHRMDDLAAVIQWLSSVYLTRKASWVLEQLEDELRYNRYLRKSSGFPETGEGRVQNVLAFIEYAKEKGTCADLLEHIEHISFKKHNAQKSPRQRQDMLSIMTTFRAKGLEWPIVLIPDCNEGIIPFSGNIENLEEERRLFYVALTRAKKELHLYTHQTTEISRFLKEANHEEILQAVDKVQIALHRTPEDWTTQDALALAQYAQHLNLERYLTFWWDAPDAQKAWVAKQVQMLFDAAQQRELTQQLGLNPEHAELWEIFSSTSSTSTDEDYPDLDMFVIHPPDTATTQPTPSSAETPPLPEEPPYTPGSSFEHPTFGQGKIIEVTEINHHVRLTVDFGDIGIKKIAPLL
tara:strand:+ start:5693 stop:8182 length:2490 start_codon:yes stop_codon:yes gene_type:complete